MRRVVAVSDFVDCVREGKVIGFVYWNTIIIRQGHPSMEEGVAVAFTIENALQIYPFSESRIIAGHGGLARPITGINVLDAPDILNWVKSGELLLTTAYAIRDRLDHSAELVAGLDARNCAGLGIKLGRFIDNIPPEMAYYADRAKFPIMALPLKHTLADQMAVLFSAIMGERSGDDWLFKWDSIMSTVHEPIDLPDWFAQLQTILGISLSFTPIAGDCPPLGTVGPHRLEDPGVAVMVGGRSVGMLHLETGMTAELQGIMKVVAALVGFRLSLNLSQVFQLFANQVLNPQSSKAFVEEVARRGWVIPSQYRILGIRGTLGQDIQIPVEKLLRVAPEWVKLGPTIFRTTRTLWVILNTVSYDEFQVARIIDQWYAWLKNADYSVVMVLSPPSMNIGELAGICQKVERQADAFYGHEGLDSAFLGGRHLIAGDGPTEPGRRYAFARTSAQSRSV